MKLTFGWTLAQRVSPQVRGHGLAFHFLQPERQDSKSLRGTWGREDVSGDYPRAAYPRRLVAPGLSEQGSCEADIFGNKAIYGGFVGVLGGKADNA